MPPKKKQCSAAGDKTTNGGAEDAHKHLQCEICSQPAQEAMVSENCGHLFCKACIEEKLTSRVTCPVCRNKLNMDLLRADTLARRKIKELPSGCPNDGCTWAGTIGTRAAHLKKCDCVPEPCPFHHEGCKAMVAPKNVKEHLNDEVAEHLNLAVDDIDAAHVRAKKDTAAHFARLEKEMAAKFGKMEERIEEQQVEIDQLRLNDGAAVLRNWAQGESMKLLNDVAMRRCAFVDVQWPTELEQAIRSAEFTLHGRQWYFETKVVYQNGCYWHALHLKLKSDIREGKNHFDADSHFVVLKPSAATDVDDHGRKICRDKGSRDPSSSFGSKKVFRFVPTADKNHSLAHHSVDGWSLVRVVVKNIEFSY